MPCGVPTRDPGNAQYDPAAIASGDSMIGCASCVPVGCASTMGGFPPASDRELSLSSPLPVQDATGSPATAPHKASPKRNRVTRVIGKKACHGIRERTIPVCDIWSRNAQ
jgi:hypothetical protein